MLTFVGLSRRRPLPSSAKLAVLFFAAGTAFAAAQPVAAQTLKVTPTPTLNEYSVPLLANSPITGSVKTSVTSVVALQAGSTHPNIAQHYLPPDIQTGNSQPEPGALVPFTLTPGATLTSGLEIDGEAGYQAYVNGSWGPVTKFPQPFTFTYGGATSATYTVPALNWTQLKVIVSSSLLQNGTVTQTNQAVFNYTP